MNRHRGGPLQRLAMLTCLLVAVPSAASAQAGQACEMGAISEITFDRQKPFLPEATSEDAKFGGVFRTMNAVHIATKEGTIRWELLSGRATVSIPYCSGSPSEISGPSRTYRRRGSGVSSSPTGLTASMSTR